MLEEATIREIAQADVARALAEDLGTGAEKGDVSADLILPDTEARAQVITRDGGVFCGTAWVEETAHQVDSRIAIDWRVSDGERVQPEQVLFRMSGPARGLLSAERTMLNFVQLLSGTATVTQYYVDLIKHTSTTLLDTRKTLPGLRLAQKYAVTCGGGQNHRLGLYDAYLLKENHIAAAGGITHAVHCARQSNPQMPVEVEVENLQELREAMDAGADIAMVDNFSLADTHAAVDMSRGIIKLEASGGIDEKTITEIAGTGVDYISMGALTKVVQPMDLSMRFVD